LESVILQKEASKDKLEEMRRGFARHFTLPVVSVIVRTGISPNVITWLGFALSVFAAGLAAYGYLFAAGLVSFIAAFCDTLDGALARRLNPVTRFGGVLDSTLDRFSEGVMFLGILVWYLRTSDERPFIPMLLVGITIIASYLVSYIRARAEGVGLKCEVGISTRTERVILTSLGLLFSQITVALVVVAVMSSVTVCQRLYYVWQQTRKDKT
jgi:CDP-diacylglycerol--glycerol-3-phosphate 3-phosphatidyltransferase